MHPQPTRARCSLHLLLVGRDGGRPDPAGLLTVLGDRADVASVAAWSPGDQGPDAETVRRAADLLDDLERRTGARPRYVEPRGLIGAVVEGLTAADDGRDGSIVAVSSRAPRRVVRALRRSAAVAGAHLAVLPPATDGARRPQA